MESTRGILDRVLGFVGAAGAVARRSSNRRPSPESSPAQNDSDEGEGRMTHTIS